MQLTPLFVSTVTRTHKENDRAHASLANGTATAEDHLPRYFAKAGQAGTDPMSTKKQGSGRGNWYVQRHLPKPLPLLLASPLQPERPLTR